MDSKNKKDVKSKEEEKKVVFVPKRTADIQRLKLEKLMRNPQKPAFVPEKPEDKLPRVFNPPEFIRNIWGSSAGVGSGDFHVYRGVRRREYARQKFQDFMSEQNEKDEEFRQRVDENKKSAEDKTAKKRAKRLKKKQKQKNKKQKLQKREESSESESEEEDDEPQNEAIEIKTEKKEKDSGNESDAQNFDKSAGGTMSSSAENGSQNIKTEKSDTCDDT